MGPGADSNGGGTYCPFIGPGGPLMGPGGNDCG